MLSFIGLCRSTEESFRNAITQGLYFKQFKFKCQTVQKGKLGVMLETCQPRVGTMYRVTGNECDFKNIFYS